MSKVVNESWLRELSSAGAVMEWVKQGMVSIVQCSTLSQIGISVPHCKDT